MQTRAQKFQKCYLNLSSLIAYMLEPGATVDENGKWWPPFGWAKGVLATAATEDVTQPSNCVAAEDGPEPGCVGGAQWRYKHVSTTARVIEK